MYSGAGNYIPTYLVLDHVLRSRAGSKKPYFCLRCRHEELLDKGGLYSAMWLRQQQQAQDSDSASDTEAKDSQSEKLQPSASSAAHKAH